MRERDEALSKADWNKGASRYNVKVDTKRSRIALLIRNRRKFTRDCYAIVGNKENLDLNLANLAYS